MGTPIRHVESLVLLSLVFTSLRHIVEDIKVVGVARDFEDTLGLGRSLRLLLRCYPLQGDMPPGGDIPPPLQVVSLIYNLKDKGISAGIEQQIHMKERSVKIVHRKQG